MIRSALAALLSCAMLAAAACSSLPPKHTRNVNGVPAGGATNKDDAGGADN